MIFYGPLEIPRIISGGHAGMWFAIGCLMYLISGSLGSFYSVKLYRNRKSTLGLILFTLCTVGVIITT